MKDLRDSAEAETGADVTLVTDATTEGVAEFSKAGETQ
jgi:hypothetical protein